MPSLTLLLTAVVLPIFPCAFHLWRNLRAAKSSGIPYILIPIDIYSSIWLASFPIVRTIFRPLRPLLPLSLYWRIELTFDTFPFYHGHTTFRYMGTDTFLIVTPTGNVLMTCDAEVIAQTLCFPKPVHLYGVLDIYGKNLITAEGKTWRKMRRIVGPVFAAER